MPDLVIRLRTVDARVLLPTWIKGGVVAVLLLWMAGGCAPPTPSPLAVSPTAQGAATEQLLRAEIRSWLGTPYRMGGMSRRGIDCSGLVVVLYDALFDLRLPRTTASLMRTGERVAPNQLSAGDLVFFKPGFKIRHVGIFLGDGEFAHASTSRGVMISRLDEAFWQTCYLTGRRVREPLNSQ